MLLPPGSDTQSASNFSDTLTASEFSETASEFSDTASACSEAPNAVIDALFAEAGPVLESCSGAGENIQPDQQQSASSYFAAFNPEEDSDEAVPHVDESRLVPPQSSANSRDELLNLMYEEAQEAGSFLANGSGENFPSDVPPHIDESLLSPLQSSVPDDPNELINMMYEGAIQFLTDDSSENFLGDVLPEIDESQLMPPQCSAVQPSPVDQDELVKPDKETQEANPAKDSEVPPAVELQDGSEAETPSESGGEETLNYLELEPSAFDMEKVPYLGKFLTTDEMRAGLAALKRMKELMRAINEIESKHIRTIFDDHIIPLEEYPGYCDLQAEYQAIQSRLTLDKPGENVPDDYFENFMPPAKSNRKKKFKGKRKSNCKRRR
ncbi:unnamed protein product [Bemisia tabaci]|uniref:Uncharacterized protein n=2 Tax=Bemisia tabaci TaxID=7038 RepID=A0A9P0A5J9_BEMTA|nr:unnamed protein product [Bemisia tabaci]